MKKFILPILLILLLLSACTAKNNNNGSKVPNTTPRVDSPPAPGRETSLKVSDYFPLTKDLHMKYRGSGNEYAEYETFVDYIKGNIMQQRSINAGTTTVTIYEVKDGEVAALYRQGETYHRYDYTDNRGDREILIKEPIKVGTTWSLKNGNERTISAIDRDVSTPLGNYKALEVTTSGTDFTLKDFYVKDMGLVRSIFTPKNATTATVVSELEKFEKDVPFRHMVRFYFPDFNNDRLVYIDRPVDINTNQDMKFKFQKELKTIPEKSNLAKVLTPNVQILGISLDQKAKIVTVDFSSHLINEMNAGSGLEAMIVQSITNTFGNYYDVNKVVITIEGKPYASGHIALKPGEYFNVDTKGNVEYGK